MNNQLRHEACFAKLSLYIQGKNKKSIGVGGLFKNTICFLCGKTAMVSNSFGDLEYIENYNQFEITIKNFIKKNDFQPEIIVSDRHPDFLSGLYAEKFSKEKKIQAYKIQHHYAHLLSVLAENNFYKKSIGVLFDGTGYGDDGNIWGGEFIVGDFSGYTRAAHLAYRKLP